MKVNTNWLLEKDTFSENLDPIKQAIKKLGHDFKETSYVPFQSGTYSHLLPENDCNITYGSIQLVNEIKTKCNWTPGVYADFEKFECTNYYNHFSGALLNHNYTIIRYDELIKNKKSLFESHAVDGCVFVRPSSGQKLFTGKVVEWERFEKEVEYFDFYEIPKDTMCIVSVPKNIVAEWRHVCVNKQIVSSSQYRYNGKHDLEEGSPADILKLAGTVATYWQPEECWIIDICELKDGSTWLLEIGAFSCAGLYKCNPEETIKAVSDQAMRDWTKK